jgi:hypothetical protein
MNVKNPYTELVNDEQQYVILPADKRDCSNTMGPKQTKKKNSWSANPEDGQSVLL